MLYKDEIDRVLCENNMHPQSFDMDAELHKFKTQFKDGLQPGNDSSLMMIPTFLPVVDSIPVNKKIITVDAGGTNFRVALISFDDKGEITVEDFRNYPMPGSNGTITREEFFSTVAEYLLPVADKADTVGYCFSYPSKALPDRDGEIIAFCKEVMVTDAAGAHIGVETERALKKLGAKGSRKYTLLNDTVAAMLAAVLGTAQGNYDGFIGFILGTGLNACCSVKTSDIKKIDIGGFGYDEMIINTELGIYSGFPQGSVDKELDAASVNPNDHLFEKMVSGAYMGNVILKTLQLFIGRDVFSSVFCSNLAKVEALPLRDVDAYLRGETDNALGQLSSSANDLEALGYIIGLLYLRAAQMVAVAFAGILICTDKGGSPERPCCVCAEGTTFRKSEHFREILDMLVEEYIGKQHNRYLEFVAIENATLAGTAVAGLID